MRKVNVSTFKSQLTEGLKSAKTAPASQLRQTKKRVPQGRKRSVRSSLLDTAIV
jgi:hypothetical protein